MLVELGFLLSSELSFLRISLSPFRGVQHPTAQQVFSLRGAFHLALENGIPIVGPLVKNLEELQIVSLLILILRCET